MSRRTRDIEFTALAASGPRDLSRPFVSGRASAGDVADRIVKPFTCVAPQEARTGRRPPPPLSAGCRRGTDELPRPPDWLETTVHLEFGDLLHVGHHRFI
jgi:hypothetical protein